MVFPLSRAHLAALVAFQLSIILLFISPVWALLPPGIFVLLCVLAPFFPGSRFYLPVVSRGFRRKRWVGLSFDDGPDPQVTPAVLDLLDRYNVKAAFFLIAEKAQAHPVLVREILSRGHEVGNHSWHHDPSLMLRGSEAIRLEVTKAQEIFASFGIRPMAFRPPVGITALPLWRILIDEGMYCLNFSCRAGDFGNRKIHSLARRILGKLKARDLILLHDVMPSQDSVEELLHEFDELLRGIQVQGLKIVPVSTLVGRQVMGHTPDKAKPAERFYNDLAPTYDFEQFKTGVSRARRAEQALFDARLPALLKGGERVLEIGAGTGIFTLPLAAKAREVLAVDLSQKMLDLLDGKAKAAGLHNIVTRVADVEQTPLEGPFDLVCAFSALEYLHDLPGLLKRLNPQMAPEGRLYLLTARRSLFRLFTQIGNALRQGLWLRARSRREMIRMLEAAGFEVISIEGHLMKSFIFGGMVLEVEARIGASRGDAETRRD